MKHTNVQYSHSFSDRLWSEDDSFHIWECWKINIVIIKCIPQVHILFQNRYTSLHTKKVWPISSVWSQYEHTGVFVIFISNNFLLQFMILLIILYWNDCNFVSRKQIKGLKIHQPIPLQTYKTLHGTFFISIHIWVSHISFAYNIHNWILWWIYLTVKLHRFDKWKVPS